MAIAAGEIRDTRDTREAIELQGRVMAFVRAFGLHRPDETPCGAPVSPSEAHALTVLAAAGSLTQTGISRQLALRKSTVSRLVDQLVARGWAVRGASPEDGRCRVVRLTGAGTRAAAELARARQARMARLLDRIPAGERAAVLGALDVLTEAARAG